MKNLAQLKEFLSTPRKIFITTHRKPDGDALGSSLGLYHYLKLKGHHPTVVVPTDYPSFLNWLPGNDSVIIFEDDKIKATNILNDSELVFCLDFNSYQRIDDMGHVLKESNIPKVMIDHHLMPDHFAEFELWDSSASATAELVYKFIHLLGDAYLITSEISSCLYTGILTDTGSFKFPSVSFYTHLVVSKLMETAFDHGAIHEHIYDSMTVNRSMFYGYCMSQKFEFLKEYKTAIIHIGESEIQKYNIQTGDTEGLVNLPMSIQEVRMSVLIIKRPDMVKLSIRTKGSIPANEICSKYFEGGGHLNASGGKSAESLIETVKKVKSILPEYKAILNNY